LLQFLLSGVVITAHVMSGLIQGKPVNRPRGRSRRWAPGLGQEKREEMQKARRLNGRF
jgi:hypothetical protein